MPVILLNRRALVASGGAAALGLPSLAAADAAFGPKVGTRAPDIGALSDQTSKVRRLAELSGPKGVLLMFFRAASWCPYCQAQLIAMNDANALFEGLGYRIVGLSYEAPAANQEFTRRREIRYVLLSDPRSVVIDRWGLRDPQYPAGNLAYGVPRPIIFAIDRKGIIRGSIAEATFKNRPPVPEIVKMIQAIR